jgi:hypothetical protein
MTPPLRFPLYLAKCGHQNAIIPRQRKQFVTVIDPAETEEVRQFCDVRNRKGDCPDYAEVQK